MNVFVFDCTTFSIIARKIPCSVFLLFVQKQYSSSISENVSDEQDILEQERVNGQLLPDELKDLAEKDVSSFRTGIEDDKKLSHSQRLQKLYPWLRRALVVMDPPPVKIDLTVTPSVFKKIEGAGITCTDEHKKLFDDVAMPANEKLFIDNCSTKKIEERK